MGEEYIYINLDRQEYISPDTLGWGGKRGSIFSDKAAFPKLYLTLMLQEGTELGTLPWSKSQNPIIGSWAGDRTTILGDYDGTGMYQNVTRNYKDITHEAAQAYNQYLEIHELNNYPNYSEMPETEIEAKLKLRG